MSNLNQLILSFDHEQNFKNFFETENFTYFDRIGQDEIFYNKKSFYTYAFPYKNIIIDKNTWGNLIAAIRSY